MCPSTPPLPFDRRGGVYPRWFHATPLVPRNTMRSMHKVMRLAHGLRYGLGLILLGHTPHTLWCALMWFYVWFAGFYIT
jgi:hypothetical protein